MASFCQFILKLPNPCTTPFNLGRSNCTSGLLLELHSSNVCVSFFAIILLANLVFAWYYNTYVSVASLQPEQRIDCPGASCVNQKDMGRTRPLSNHNKAKQDTKYRRISLSGLYMKMNWINFLYIKSVPVVENGLWKGPSSKKWIVDSVFAS